MHTVMKSMHIHRNIHTLTHKHTHTHIHTHPDTHTHTHRRRSHTEVVGSPYWMAPECLNGKNYCEQADVFSYGIMLAEVLARIPADPDFMPRTQVSVCNHFFTQCIPFVLTKIHCIFELCKLVPLLGPNPLAIACYKLLVPSYSIGY